MTSLPPDSLVVGRGFVLLAIVERAVNEARHSGRRGPAGGRPRLQIGTVALTLAVARAASLSAADESWLPPPVEKGVLAQLESRLQELGEKPPPPDVIHRSAMALVSGMRETIETWGVAGTLAKAPTFPAIAVPPPAGRYLDAMQRNQLCNFVLLRQLEDPAFATDINARFTATLGLSAVTMAILRLRQPFVTADGDPQQIEPALTGSALEAVVQSMEADPATRSHAEERCQPVVVGLLELPLRRMNERVLSQ